MNKAVVLSIVLASSLPLTASADSNVIRSNGALATFEHVSSDGCVHTVGELALLDSAEGAENASGVYITGSQEDVCAGTGNGFATFSPGDVRVVGLLFAQYRGRLTAESYSGGEDIFFGVDLKWLGRGAITRERNEWDEEGVMTFSATARRDAKTFGYVRADGESMQITSATLISETRGTL